MRLPRPILQERVEQFRAGCVVTIVAPVGYGKTLLLDMWQSLADLRCVRISLEDRHNDPGVLIGEFLASLADQAPPHRKLSTEVQGGHPVSSLVLTTLRGTHALVLIDNMHVLYEPRSLSVLQALADDTPSTVLVGLAGRRGIGVDLACARRQGRLLQLGPADLLFSRAELQPLRRAGFSEAALDALHQGTGGWPLAIGSLAASGAGASVVSGEVRKTVADLFADDIHGKEAPLVDFLLAAAVVSPADARLLDATRQRSDSLAFLTDIEQAPIPLCTADEGWIGFHPAAEEYLRAQLRIRQPEREAELLRNAAQFLLVQGNVDRSFELLLRAGDRRELARFAYTVGRSLAFMGRRETVRDWVRVFSPAEIQAYGEIQVLCMIVDGADGNFTALGEWIRLFDSVDLGPVIHEELGDVPPVQVICELLGLAPVGAATAEALARSGWWSTLAQMTMGFLYLGRGELIRAEGVLTAVAPFTEPVPILEMWRLACLAYVFALRGEHDRSAPLMAQAVALWAQRGVDHSPLTAGMDALMAFYSATEGSDREQANRHLNQSIRQVQIMKQLLPRRAVIVQLMLAQAAIGLGRPRVAAEALRDIDEASLDCDEDRFLIDRAQQLATELRDYQRSLNRSPLSGREQTVLTMLATPAPVPEIARRLGRSPGTVRAQIRSIYTKLGVHHRLDAVTTAKEQGLLVPHHSGTESS